MKIDIPGSGPLVIEAIILDLNGTLCVEGQASTGCGAYSKLRQKCHRPFLGRHARRCFPAYNDLGIAFTRTKTGQDKADEAEKLQTDKCAAIGNGLIDLQLIQRVKTWHCCLTGRGGACEHFCGYHCY